MSDIKISQLPVASVVNDADIVVLNQGGDTKTAAKSLIVAGLATTNQLSGLATTTQIVGLATTAQLSAFQNSAQVQSITSAQIAAITPASIGALSTDAASGFATTSQISGFATTTDIQGIAFTSQLNGFATTDQISGFTNSAQVEALASAQIAAITPASIGAFATSDVIGISSGGTGATDSTAALAALGGMPLNQAAGGDLIGSYPDPTVAKLRGWDISANTPFGGAVLQWVGTEWTPTSPSTGNVTSVGTGSGLTGGPITSDGVISLETTGVAALTYGSSTQVAVLDVNAFGQITSAYSAAITPAGIGALDATAAAGGDLTGNYPNPTVAKLQGYDVSSSVPTSGQVLTWNGSAWVATASATGGSGGGGVLFYLNYGTLPDAPAPADSKELGRIAEVAQTSVQSAVLTSGVWTDIAGFVSDTLDPNLQDIPAGIFDFNVWAKSDANANAPTLLRVQVYKWDGTTSTSIATSGTAVVSNNGTTVQTAISVVIPQTDVTPTDRLYILLQVQASAAGHTATIDFGDGTPSHVHTTIPSVGGTGVVKVINGVPQNPASLITDSDVSTAAPLALDKVQMGQVSVLSGAGLTGGGDLSTSRIIALQTTGIAAISGAGSSVAVPVISANIYGQITALTTEAIAVGGSGTVTSITAGTGLSGGTITSSGTIALSTAGPGIITAGSSTAVPVITLDEYGRISALSTAPISGGGGGGGTGEGMQFAVVRHNTQVIPASAGTVNLSAWASGATTINFSATPSFTLVPGMVINAAGLNTIAIRTVVSPTQVILASGAVVAGSAASSVTVQNSTATTLTVTAGALPTYDGRTLQLNDVVYLTAQGAAGGSTPTAQNGPWVVTTLGATGVSAVFTRPSWFTGTLGGPKAVGITGGTANYGFTFSISGNIAGNTSYLVGVDPLLSIGIASRSTLVTVTNTSPFTAKQTFAANSTTVNPFSFSTTASQTLLTTAALGAVEWDNQQMYVTSSTPAAGLTRNPIATAMVPINNQTASYTLVLADSGKMIVVNSASATAITIPLQATVNFPIGTQILVMQTGSAQISIVAASGVTLNNRSGVTTSGQYSVISLIKIAADSWVVAGDATI